MDREEIKKSASKTFRMFEQRQEMANITFIASFDSSNVHGAHYNSCLLHK